MAPLLELSQRSGQVSLREQELTFLLERLPVRPSVEKISCCIPDHPENVGVLILFTYLYSWHRRKIAEVRDTGN